MRNLLAGIFVLLMLVVSPAGWAEQGGNIDSRADSGFVNPYDAMIEADLKMLQRPAEEWPESDRGRLFALQAAVNGEERSVLNDIFAVLVQLAGVILIAFFAWLFVGRSEQIWRNHQAWRAEHGDAPTSGIWQPVALALVFLMAVAIWRLRMA